MIDGLACQISVPSPTLNNSHESGDVPLSNVATQSIYCYVLFLKSISRMKSLSL